MAHYDFERIKILKGGFVAHEVRDVAPAEVCEVLDDPERFMFWGEEEVERVNEVDDMARLYWDEKLRRSGAELRRLVLRLAELGFVGFRKKLRGRIGIFVVHK